MGKSIKYRLCELVDNDPSHLRIVGDGSCTVSYPEAPNSSFGPHISLDCSGPLGQTVLMLDLEDFKRVAREALGVYQPPYQNNVVQLKLVSLNGKAVKG